MPKVQSIDRAEFIRRFRYECGIDYVTARRVYLAMCSVIEGAVVDGHRIRIGRVGVINPTWSKPKKVVMGMDRSDGKLKRCRREIHIGSRIKYRFKLYKQFMAKHELKWF